MRWLALIAIAIMLGGSYYHFLYPPTVYKRATQQALDDFTAIAERKDRVAIAAQLQGFLSGDAAIRLEVSMFAISGSGNTILAQDFDKASFVAFIDTTLSTLTDYHYQARVQDFVLSDDHASAAITFASSEWADGLSYYAGAGVDMRFTSDMLCTGNMKFTGTQPQLAKAVCKMQLRMVPKPGQDEKLRNPEALRQLLR